MKFYKFGSEYPYTAVVWAENEEKAIALYIDEICELDKECLNLKPDIVDVDIVAKETLDNTLNIMCDEEDARINGISSWFFEILTSKFSCVVLTDSALY